MKRVFFTIWLTFLLAHSTFSQWNVYNVTGQTSFLTELCVVNDNVIWAMDQNKESVSISLDGGKNWTIKSLPNVLTNSYGGFCAVNSTTAYIVVTMGDIGIYKTVDSGSTWNKQVSGFTNTSFPNFVHFYNENEGFVFGDGNNNLNLEIYTTSDGGANWTLVPQSNMPNGKGNYSLNTRMSFRVVNNTVFAYTNMGIYKTNDKGKTWTAATNTPYGSFDFRDEMNGLLLKTNTSYFKTTDGGASTQFVPYSPYTNANSTSSNTADVFYYPQRNIYFVSDANYGLSYTSDEGQSWIQHPTFANIGAGAITISASGKLYIGGWGKLYTTTDFTSQNTVLLTASTTDSKQIDLTFNDAISKNEAENPNNYILSYYNYEKSKRDTLTIQSASLDAINPKVVHVSAQDNFSYVFTSLRITANLTGTNGYPILPNDVTFFSTNEPIAVLTTSQEIGNSISLSYRTKKPISIDWGSGRVVYTNISTLEKPTNMLASQTVKIYGSSDAITRLGLSGCHLQSLDISENMMLDTLLCADNQLQTLDISKNTALKYLNCGTNQLTSLDLTKNTALLVLACHFNKLQNLDISKNTLLKYIWCYNNQLSSLDASNNTQLIQLVCYSNQIATLNVSKSPSLAYLYCYSNQLTSIDLSNNTQLISLDCSYNNINELDVTKNILLQELFFDYNQITTIDVTKNTALTYLSCYKNKLTTLDVTKNTALFVLWCTENQLQSLDITKNTLLTQLYCGNNSLTSLDVSQNTNLITLNCSNNQLSAEALNNTFIQLPNVQNIPINEGEELWKKILNIAGNPGALTSATIIATTKGWICDVQGTGVDPNAIRIRFSPPSDWQSSIYIWAWTSTGNVFNVSWPGKEMTNIGNGWWEYVFDSSIKSVNVVFSNNGTVQSADLMNVTTSGCYKLGLTANNSGNYNPEQTNCDQTGVEQIKAGSPVSIYPNPVKNTLYIQTQNNNGSVIISTLDGKQVKSISNYQKNQLVDVTNLKTGLYIIKITTSDGKTYSGKFVKE